MQFQRTYINGSYLHKKYYFQPSLTLRNDVFAIKDEDITYKKVQALFSEMSKQRQFLFQKMEDFIELGTLQSWAIKLTEKAIDSFLECVKDHNIQRRIEIEEDLYKILSLLADIQMFLISDSYGIVCLNSEARLDNFLLRRERNIFQVAIQSDSFKINYVINKYLFSLLRNGSLFEEEDRNTQINQNIKQFCLYQLAFLQAVNTEDNYLHLGHFLPEYFDSEIAITLSSKKYSHQETVVQAISNKETIQLQPSDFIFNEIQKETTFSEITDHAKYKELVRRKLQRTQNSIQERVYLCLAYFFVFEQYHADYFEKHSYLQNHEQPENLIQSILSLKFEQLSEMPEIITEFLLKELLQTKSNFNFQIPYGKPKQMEQLKKYVDLYLKPSGKINNPVFSSCVIKNIGNLGDYEIPDSIFDLTDEREYQRFKDLQTVLFKELQEYILESVLQGDYSNVMLVHLVEYDNTTKDQLSQIYIKIFELQERNSHLDSVNLQQSLQTDISEQMQEQILKQIANSSPTALLDYIHSHYVEKNCPYGSFFVFHMIIGFEKFYQGLELTEEKALKLLSILQRHFEDFKSINASSEQCMVEIFEQLGSFFKKHQMNTEYEQLGGLFLKFSFYFNKTQSFLVAPFDFEDIPLFYEKMIMEKMKAIQTTEKIQLTEQLQSFSAENYQITRTLLRVEKEKNHARGFLLLNLIGDYFNLFSNIDQKTMKIKKQTFRKLIQQCLTLLNSSLVTCKEMIINIQMINYCNFTYSSLVDDDNNKIKGENIVTFFLEILEEFLNENEEILRNAIKRRTQYLKKSENLLNHLGYCASQDYEGGLICSQYTFLISIATEFVQNSSWEQEEEKKADQLTMNKTMKNIYLKVSSLYDSRALNEILYIKQYNYLKEECQQQQKQQQLEILRSYFKNNLKNPFLSDYLKSNKLKNHYCVETIPSFFLKILQTFLAEYPVFESCLNPFISYRFGYQLKGGLSQENLPPQTPQECLEAAKLRLFGETMKDVVDSQTLLKGWDQYQQLSNFFSELDIKKSSPFISLEKITQSVQEENNSNHYQYYYTNNLEEILSELVVWQELLINFLETYKLSTRLADVSKEANISAFLTKIFFLGDKQSFEITQKLMRLSKSSNINHKKSPNTIPLLSRYIQTNIQIELLLYKYYQNPFQQLSDTSGIFIDFYSKCLGVQKQLDVSKLVSEIQEHYAFCGSMVNSILGQTKYRENEIVFKGLLKIIENQFETDFSNLVQIKKQQQLEQDKQAKIDEINHQDNNISDHTGSSEEKINLFLNNKTQMSKDFVLLVIKKITWQILNIEGIKESFTDETFSAIQKHFKKIEKLPYLTTPIETIGLGIFMDQSFSKDVQNKHGQSAMESKQFYQNLFFFLKQFILFISKKHDIIKDLRSISFLAQESENSLPEEDSQVFSCQNEFIEQVKVSVEVWKEKTKEKCFPCLKEIQEQISYLPIVMKKFALKSNEFEQIYDLILDLADILLSNQIVLPKGDILFDEQKKNENQLIINCLQGLKSLSNFVNELKIERLERLVKLILKQKQEMPAMNSVLNELVYNQIQIIFVAKGRGNIKRYLVKQISEDIVNIKKVKEINMQKIQKYNSKLGQEQKIKEDCRNCLKEIITQKSKLDEGKQILNEEATQVKDVEQKIKKNKKQEEKSNKHDKLEDQENDENEQKDEEKSQPSQKSKNSIESDKETIQIEKEEKNNINEEENDEDNEEKMKSSHSLSQKDDSDKEEKSQNKEEDDNKDEKESDKVDDDESEGEENEDNDESEDEENDEDEDESDKDSDDESENDSDNESDSDNDDEEDEDDSDGSNSRSSHSSKSLSKDSSNKDENEMDDKSIKKKKLEEDKLQKQIEEQLLSLPSFRITSSELQSEIISKYANLCIGCPQILQQAIDQIFELAPLNDKNDEQKEKKRNNKSSQDDEDNEDSDENSSDNISNNSDTNQHDNDDEDKSHKGEKETTSKSEKTFMLRNAEEVKNLYDQRTDFVKISTEQAEFIKVLVDNYISQVNEGVNEKLNPIQSSQSINKSILPSESSKYYYIISLNSLGIFILQLLKQYNSFVLPLLTTLTIKNLSEQSSELLPFFKYQADESLFLDFLLHVDPIIDMCAQDTLLEIVKLSKQSHNITKYIFAKTLKLIDLISQESNFLKSMTTTFAIQNILQFLQKLLEIESTPQKDQILIIISLLDNIISKAKDIESLRLIRRMELFQFYNDILLKYAKSIYGKDIQISEEIEFNSKYFFTYFDKNNISNNLIKGTINTKEILEQFLIDTQEDNITWIFEKEQIDEPFMVNSDNQIQQIWSVDEIKDEQDILFASVIYQTQIEFEERKIKTNQVWNQGIFEYLQKLIMTDKQGYSASPLVMKEYYLNIKIENKSIQIKPLIGDNNAFFLQINAQLIQLKNTILDNKSEKETMTQGQLESQEAEAETELQHKIDQFQSLSTSDFFALIKLTEESQDQPEKSADIDNKEKPTEKKDKEEEKEEQQQQQQQSADELYDSESLKKYGVTKKEFQQIDIQSRQEFIDQKKKEYLAKEKEKKLESIKRREQILMSQLFGENDVANGQKNDLRQYLSSKDFKGMVKKLSEGEKRLILISQDNEYLELLEDQLQKKSKIYHEKQKITRKKKQKNEKDKQEKNKQTSTKLLKIVKNSYNKINDVKKQTQKAKQKLEDENRIQKSLQVPLMSEELAMKLLVLSISPDIDIQNSDCVQSILQSFFLNPINYLRILGLLLLTASNIFASKTFNIPWIDDHLFDNFDEFIKEIDPKELLLGKDEDSKREYQRKYLLMKCAEMIKQLLSDFSYGVRILQLEEMIFFKEANVENLQFLEDSSNNLKVLGNNKVQTINTINEDSLELQLQTFNSLSFKDASFPIVQKNQEMSFTSFEEFGLKLLELENFKGPQFGKLQDGERYGTKEMKIEENNQNRLTTLVNTVFDLLETISDRVIVSHLHITDKPKNQVFYGQDSKSLSVLPIVDIENQIVVTQTNSKRSQELLKKILEKAIQIIVVNSISINNVNSFETILKKSIVSLDTYLKLSGLMFQEYQKITKVVLEDIVEMLKVYKSYLKTKFNIEVIQEGDSDETKPGSYELCQPINDLITNVSSFYSSPFMSSFCDNLKMLIKSKDNILPPKMLPYYQEFLEKSEQQGNENAVTWWKEKEQLERQYIVEQIKGAWMEETKPLPNIYRQFFAFIHLVSSFQEIKDEDNIPNYYQDFLQCPSTFVLLYEKLFSGSQKIKDIVLDQNEVILNEDDIQLPAFRRIHTHVVNDEEDEEEEDKNNEEDDRVKNLLPSAIRKLSLTQQKTSSEIQAEELNKILKNDLISFVLTSQEEPWCQIILSMDFSTRSTQDKLKFIKAYSLHENMLRKEASRYVNMCFTIDREQMWYSFLTSFTGIRPSNLIEEDIDISFKDEEGIDAGGVSREFYSLIFKDLVDPSKGFFSPSANGITTQPSPYSSVIPDHLMHFQYAGRLLAKSVFSNYNCEVDFTRSFLKQILGQDLYIADLEDIDPELSKNLLWILENDVSELYIDFTYTYHQLGRQTTIELKPNGAAIEVNEKNKKEYVKLVAQYRMVTQIQPQVKAFQQGFYEIIPFQAIKVLTVSEFGFKLSGEHSIDIEDMKQHMDFNDYTKDSPQILWLFELLSGYTQEQLGGFLFFITGSFRVPFGGFKNFKITISKKGTPQSFPVAHTCSKEMELPLYDSKEVMFEKLEIAFGDGAKGFFIG